MKKFGSLLLATTILAGIALAPATSFAADGGNYDSNGVITFTPNTDITNPVDPVDPTNPVTPVDPTDPTGPKPGTAGPLSIDYASSLDFGTQKITSKDEVYKAKAQKYLDKDNNEKTGPNFVQVTDNRGTEAGWTLQMKQNSQFKTTDAEELTGAVITFKNGNVVTASDSAKPTGQATIVADPSGALKNVMAAKDGQGAGTYLLDWGTDAATAAESIELSVPGSTTKYAKKYSTTFTWVLTDTPGN
ncbi:WxL domain-containing protein [Enterococcus avium]|uniref:WxL domain-containing protein n=1 Tax=Enterococcus avium TaxID=33945 RepID=A0ABD5F7K4_ENTAV|nr:WxL domain-containing protein [Enterococcus avium]MDT2397109.1 WxL domain-containing protein [Enterococcus avium]MDT2434997.1 WxL domain-containing protein [Enterococcus avium]MDT2449562.1 WxL domain-containing protein [Enterococcus avium]MDT2465306.1 WxL domain-containing protein [Enterococcus avium]MDT2469562.1 WxL domain-containing protein [Enterococcus avium]